MGKYLQKPESGWSSFLNKKNMRISYIDDMPYSLLEEMISSIKEQRDFCLTFDAEGYEYTIVSSCTWNKVECIMRNKEKPIVFEIEENLRTFAKKIISDIEEDFDSWKDFPATYENLSGETSKENELKLERKLKNLIIELKDVLEQKVGLYR